MRRAVASVVLAVMGVLGVMGPLRAAVGSSELAASDVVVEAGASLSAEDRERLASAAQELRDRGAPTKFVVVASRPDDAPLAARSLRRESGFGGTVLLLFPAGSLGIASGRPEALIQQAFDASRSELRSDPVGGTIAVARRLAEAPSADAATPGAPAPGGSPREAEEPGGVAGGVVLLPLLVAGFVGLRAFSRWSSRRRAQADLADRRAALEPLVDALAAHVTELGGDLRFGGEAAAAAQPFYDEAVLAYGEVRDTLPAAGTVVAVESARGTLERGLVAAQSARAVLEGRPPPPPEERAFLEGLCAFDPKHGRAVRTMPVVTPAGDEAAVPVCGACAAGLEAGEMPEPRRVYQHGVPVPYWQGLGSVGYGAGLFPMFGGFLGAMVLQDLFTPEVSPVDPAGDWGDNWGGGDFGGDWGGGDFGGDFGGGGDF